MKIIDYTPLCKCRRLLEVTVFTNLMDSVYDVVKIYKCGTRQNKVLLYFYYTGSLL